MRQPTVQYLRTINSVLDIASARMLGFVSLLGALAIFGVAIYDPDRIRTVTALAYAGTVVWPIMILYWKVDKGDQ